MVYLINKNNHKTRYELIKYFGMTNMIKNNNFNEPYIYKEK